MSSINAMLKRLERENEVFRKHFSQINAVLDILAAHRFDVPFIEERSSTETFSNGLANFFTNLTIVFSQLNTISEDFKRMNSLIPWRESIKFDVKEYKRCVSKIEKPNPCTDTSSLIRNVNEMVDALQSAVDEEYTKFLQVYQSFANMLIIHGEDIQELSDGMNKFVDRIDFDHDFNEFISEKRIVRTDMIYEDFEFYPMTSRAFDGIEKPVLPPSQIVFPIGYGDITQDFLEIRPNCIQCSCGKPLLLLEDPINEWCCAMNPISHFIGYIPSYCVGNINKWVGMILKDQNEDLPFGEFVGILSEAPTSFRVYISSHKEFDIPKQFIAVISTNTTLCK